MNTASLPQPKNLPAGTDEEIFESERNTYAVLYLNQSASRGEMKCQDGASIIFYADRYDHAFRTSPDRARRAYDKSKVALDRIERIHWIKILLDGSLASTTCKEKGPPDRWRRCYYNHDLKYIVWLEPTKIDKCTGRPAGWRFSSAYSMPIPEFKRVAHGFKTVK